MGTLPPHSLTLHELSSLSESELALLSSSDQLKVLQMMEQLQAEERERIRSESRLANREKVARHRAALREIGEIPPVADPAKRAECDRSLATFLQTCFPDIFHLAFSAAHLELINAVERAVSIDGNEAFACERGFGKTQISIGGALWGCLTGRVRYAMIIAANIDMATSQREGIKRRLETSQPLYDLYPEICYPMRTLAGSLKMSATYRGQLVRIRSRPDLVLPCIAGAPGSEAVIACTGIDSSSIRGRFYDRADGTTARPDLVMLDDPQDDSTARQPELVKKRSIKIRQAVTGMRGPGRKLAMLMPCTVIAKNDLADEFTDRQRRPEWSGRRIAAMPSMPDDLEAESPLWHQYDELRREDLAMGDKTRRRATEFYLANRAAMSEGAEITWPERVELGCVDALQALMDKFLSDRQAFLAEQQQNPQGDEDVSAYLDLNGIISRYNGLRRGQLPPSGTMLTTAIDVQEHILYWLQILWAPDLTGWMVDWGTFPKQPIADFHHMQPPRTIHDWARKTFPRQGMSWEEEHRAAIEQCLRDLPQPEGPTIGPTLIDNRWHKAQQVVESVATSEEFAGAVVPAGGIFVGGNDTAISARKMQTGSKRPGKDVEWYIKRESTTRKILLFDANIYRSQIQKGLAEEPTKPGSITYNSPFADPILAAHLASKNVRLTVDTKRELEIWQNKPGRDQDHWLDCAVMCRVAAELAGLRINGAPITKPQRTRHKEFTLAKPSKKGLR